jgi:hypothetical protein
MNYFLTSSENQMSDSIRLSKHRSLYRGKVTSDPKLRLRALNDRTALSYMRVHPSVRHIANVQSSAPRNYQLGFQRHQQPLHMIPELRGATRYIRGSSKYNQEVQRRIAELAKIIS